MTSYADIKKTSIEDIGVSGDGGGTVWTTSTNSLPGQTLENPLMVIGPDTEGTYDTNHTYKPCVIKESDTSYKMWYSGSNGVSRIMYATSTDGNNWSNHQLVIDIGAEGTYDTSFASNPSVIKESDTSYKMWYTGSNGVFRIMYATSTDGVTWSNHQMVVDRNIEGTYDTGHVHSAFTMRESASSYKMWYSGYRANTSEWRIMYATSTDGTNWSNHQMVVDTGAEGTYDTENVLAACVIKESDTSYKMWYTGKDGTSDRILYTLSSDGVNWLEHTLFLDLGLEGTYDTELVNSPYVIHTSTGYGLWYSGKNSGTSMRIIKTDVVNGTDLVNNSGYLLDTTSEGLSLTLPADPEDNFTVSVGDLKGTASSNNIIVSGNGNNINGSASNYTISTNDLVVALVFIGGTEGWKLI